jgi:hypothetical protein
MIHGMREIYALWYALVAQYGNYTVIRAADLPDK